ncbi:hypothetical protein MUY14_05055 [Amycolatopsis sp. FBCC-B4732]|uniref:hypothetical protein n=1 Tax=Amycolatopsis sp. FBCC-B4732 TaxID=3079339 RepID=UPI001FF2FFC8|nr:hypothetical protein [Amycolatopsis sp. FBCC-B4732]UOX90007.1 hypothetical protein MUY14_05055 [Amycolatopsis sp. FBCC-B4732]
MTRYRHTARDAARFSKHGIDLTVYGQTSSLVTVARVYVEKGHFEEFFDLRSTYLYYIVSGRGTFVLDDEAVVAEETDLVVVPPNTRIYYFGTMEILLTVSPSFDERNERHVRFVADSESPYR